MEEGAEEARKVDVEKQKGGEEAVVEPAVMGECFVNQSTLLKGKLKPSKSQWSSSDFFSLFSKLRDNR